MDRPSLRTRVMRHGRGVVSSGSETAIHSSLIVSYFPYCLVFPMTKLTNDPWGECSGKEELTEELTI